METTSLDAISEKLTPMEIKTKDFKRSMWGYTPSEVISFLDATARTWERVQKHEKELIEKIRIQNEDLIRWRGREGEIIRLRDKAVEEGNKNKEEATREAAQILEQAKAKAAAVREKTEQWLERVIVELEQLEGKKRDARESFKAFLDQHYDLLQRQNSESSDLAKQMQSLVGRETNSSQH